jgi:glycerol transport system ATP-binding protein
VQAGTPVELFERPRHTFVGHFIGSPGMNLMPCEVENGVARFAGHRVSTANPIRIPAGTKTLQIGVRPEFVQFADSGIPVQLGKVSDAGRYRIVDALHGDTSIKLLIDESETMPGERAHLQFDPAHTQVYADGWIAS